MAGSLSAQALHAARWSYLSSLTIAALQVVVTAVLARLLVPEAFGLIAMATLVLRFGQYFAQMGLGRAIVQRVDVSREHVSAGFWMATVIGMASAAAVWALAPIGARLFEAPELESVIRGLSVTFIFAGVSTVPLGLLHRSMRFRAVAVGEFAAFIAGSAVSIGLATAGYGVWSLVGGAVVQAMASSCFYVAFSRPFAVPIRGRRFYTDLLGFGSSVSLVSFLEFVSANLDTLFVGRSLGPGSAGVYSRALSLTGLPMQYLSLGLSRVLFASFSRIQDDRDRSGRAFVRITIVLAGVGVPLAFGLIGASGEIVQVLLGDAWIETSTIMRVTALAGLAAMLAHVGGVLLEAGGRLRVKAVLRIAQICLFLSLLWALGGYGLVGFAAAFALSELLYLVAQTVVLGRHLGVGARSVVGAHLPGLVCGLGVGTVVAVLSSVGAALGMNGLIVLLVQCTVGLSTLLCGSLWLFRGAVYKAARDVMPGYGSGLMARALHLADKLSGVGEGKVGWLRT